MSASPHAYPIVSRIRRWRFKTSSYKRIFKPLKRLKHNALNLFRGFLAFQLAEGFEPSALREE
jgi:hypothetical protein